MENEAAGVVSSDECPMAGVLAQRLRASKRDLTAQWLGRIADRITLDENRIFPTDELLDHVPLLIEGVADYVENPAAEIGVDMPVVAKAMELGALRHKQGFDAYEILKEYEFLGGILFTFFATVVSEIPDPCEKSELMACGFRLYRAVTIIQQSTMGHFLLLADKNVSEREERLRGVNRVISHEIKNRIGAVLGASSVLHEVPGMAEAKRAELVDIIGRNAREMRNTVENVLALSRTEADDVRQHRHVMLSEAVREAARQVREAAHAANIEISIDPEIPDIEVSAAVIELCVKNYLSNAIKYADPRQTKRTVDIRGAVESTASGEREIVVRVTDNGLGVPPEKREHLFERFFRAHEGTSKAEGTGLGLSIVRETAESQGGRAWAEHPQKGAVFAIALPLRREPDSPDTRRSAERSSRSA
ncbi:MAG: sensor histidine kinase [Gemmatimonadaceae bacterium]